MLAIIGIAALILFAVVINLPLGYLRENYARFSFGWYFYIHISIPLIIYMRIRSGYSWKLIPLTLGGAVVGQILGGVINRKRKQNGREEG